MKHKLNEYCPCCGYDTFDPKNRLNYSICPICFWEDDPIGFEDENFVGGANRVSLIQARENYIKFGACEESMISNTRKVNNSDTLNPEWNNL